MTYVVDGPTVHKVFGVFGRRRCAGIVMVPLAVQATVAGAQAAGLDPSGAADAVARLMNAAGAAGMIGGQLLDLIAAGQPTTVERLDEIQRGKTGALIAVSAGLGGLAGGAGAGAVARLEAFGLAIGLAFQITDDVLDVTASFRDARQDRGAGCGPGTRAPIRRSWGFRRPKRGREAWWRRRARGSRRLVC